MEIRGLAVTYPFAFCKVKVVYTEEKGVVHDLEGFQHL